jgi:apolipoprotein N-acyltransferase
VALGATGLGLALCAGMSPLGVPLLWVALVPWIAALDRRDSLRATIVLALALSAAYTLAVFAWFAFAVETYTKIPAVVALALLAVAGPLIEPQVVGFALARWWVRRRTGRRWLAACAASAAWLAVEWLAPKLFGDTLGIGLYPARALRQGADVAGVPGLTLALLAGNELAMYGVFALRRRDARAALRPAVGLAALVTAMSVYGGVRMREVAGGGAPPLSAALVQAGVGQYGRLAERDGTFVAVRRILDAQLELSSRALAGGPLDLIVWPETVYPTTFGTPKSPEGAAFDREIAGFVAREHVPLVFGTYDAEDGREYNAAVLLEPTPGGDVSFDAYRKASLFPLIEWTPPWLDHAYGHALLPWLGGWTPGDGSDVLVLTLPGGRRVRVAPLICYDAVQPTLAREAVRRGAELLLTISNDSWFGEGRGPYLHLVVSAFRSVETRRPQLRTTTTGISASITPAGDVVASAGVHERTALRVSVEPRSTPPPPVVVLGEWLGPLAAVVLLAIVALPGLRAAGILVVSCSRSRASGSATARRWCSTVCRGAFRPARVSASPAPTAPASRPS